jgi:hypothetical protein
VQKKFIRHFLPTLAVVTFLLPVAGAHAQLGKANRLFIEHGLQLQGMGQWDDIFHLDTYSNANYTSINWIWKSNPSWFGSAPGFPWARWVSDATDMPPQAGEAPYMPQLLALQLGDEWNLQDGQIRTNLIDWFVAVRTNWPNTILYHNNYGGQADDAALADFIPKAQPDMLCFDTYPFLSVWDVNEPNHTGPPIPGPFTSWYGELRRYRQWAMAYQIPFAAYLQTFHSVQDYDQHVYRYPSPSELRLNTSVALAFNAKMLTGFTYNSGATTLFDILPNGYSGDTYPNALYPEQAEINRRAINLGKALVRLKPAYDLHNTNTVSPPPGPGSDDPNFPNGYTTSILFLRGKTFSGGVTNFTPVPNSFLNDPSTQNPANPTGIGYTWWELAKNDPYLAGWPPVTNKGSIKNDGLPGDVIIAWFKPIDENFDGPNFTNEIYMMVVNALTDPAGTAADCLQQIKLNFLASVPASIVLLDSATGQLQTNTLPIIPSSGGRRQLVLDLNGGDAVLFKFNTGAPFMGYSTPSRPQLSLKFQAETPTITIQGTVGARYELQAAATLPPTNWTTLSNFVMFTSPSSIQDTTFSGQTSRFYRVTAIP